MTISLAPPSLLPLSSSLQTLALCINRCFKSTIDQTSTQASLRDQTQRLEAAAHRLEDVKRLDPAALVTMASHHIKQIVAAESEEAQMMSICRPSPQPLPKDPMVRWVEQRLARRKPPSSPTKDVVGRRRLRQTNRRLCSPHPVYPAHATEAAESMEMDWEPTEIVAAHSNITLRSPVKKKLVSPSKQEVWWKPTALREPFVAPKPSRPFEPTEMDPWIFEAELQMPNSALKANTTECIVQAERALQAADTTRYPSTPRNALALTLFHNPQACSPLHWNGPQPRPRSDFGV